MRLRYWFGDISVMTIAVGEYNRNTLSPALAVVSLDRSDHTWRILPSMAQCKEKVLGLRFGIRESFDHTLQELGQVFLVT